MAYQNQKTKYDVLRFVKRYIKDYNIISNGKEISVNCHWCSPKDYKKKLTVNAKSGLFHCWRCNEKGNFLKFHKAYGKAGGEAQDFLAGTEISRSTVSNEIETQISYPESFNFLSEASPRSRISSRPYYDYLLARGLTNSDIDYYSIGYATEGKLHHRVIVPIYSGENLVSYIARTITDAKPKVLTPPSLQGTHGVKDYIFNIDRAADTHHLIICEGVFDAIKSGISGIALFGKTATKKQLAKIINSKPRRISIFLDPDAQKEALILAKQLILHIEDVRICCVSVGFDPGSANEKMIKDALLNYKRYTELL